MRIRKLNEWKCDIDINDTVPYVEPADALRDMADHFGLIHNPRTDSYDCDGDVGLYGYYYCLSATKQSEFDKAFVNDGKMTIKFGTVKGDFFLPGNNQTPYILTSLEGCPKSVWGDFDCSYNNLTSLEGCPEKVGGGFYCNGNQLTSLEDCPENVSGDFSCAYNQLTSLEGCPETVGGDFYCNGNQLTSLEDCPKNVDGDFICRDNKVQFTEKDVRSVCYVKNKIYV